MDDLRRTFLSSPRASRETELVGLGLLRTRTGGTVGLKRRSIGWARGRALQVQVQRGRKLYAAAQRTHQAGRQQDVGAAEALAQNEWTRRLESLCSSVGLTRKAVFIVDPEKDEIVHSAEAPVKIDCGFALEGGAVYFGSAAQMWRYRLPK